MSDQLANPVQTAYEQERRTESARRQEARGSRESAAPHTPVSNEAEAESSAPQFGQEGAPSGETREVETPDRPSAAARAIIGPGREDESQILDAYWASFGDPGTRALLRSRSAQSILEVVIGADDRTQVTATREYPWRCIASLLITAQDGTNWIGTGWLVGPRILLTAGHCVYMLNHGGWARRIEVIPGRQGANRPFESAFASAFRSVTGWTQDNNRDFDYGAILLPADKRYGDRLGWFGYQMRTNEALQGALVNLSGYPGDKPAGTQWFHKNNVTQVEDRVITYQVDTAGGQSGAPVWVKQENGRYGVGIHTNGAVTGNSATRITQAVFDNINQWKAQVP